MALCFTSCKKIMQLINKKLKCNKALNFWGKGTNNRNE